MEDFVALACIATQAVIAIVRSCNVQTLW